MNESELYVKGLEEQVSLGKEMQRLLDDEGFKKIFINGLFDSLAKDIAGGYVFLKGDRLEKAHNDLYAISFLKQYIEAVVDNGSSKKEELDEYLASIEEE